MLAMLVVNLSLQLGQTLRTGFSIVANPRFKTRINQLKTVNTETSLGAVASISFLSCETFPTVIASAFVLHFPSYELIGASVEANFFVAAL